MPQPVICSNLNRIINIVQSKVVNEFLIGLTVTDISLIVQKRDFKLLRSAVTDGPETFGYFNQNTFQRGGSCVLGHDQLMAIENCSILCLSFRSSYVFAVTRNKFCIHYMRLYLTGNHMLWACVKFQSWMWQCVDKKKVFTFVEQPDGLKLLNLLAEIKTFSRIPEKKHHRLQLQAFWCWTQKQIRSVFVSCWPVLSLEKTKISVETNRLYTKES